MLEDDAIAVHTSDGSMHRFDSIYVALGLCARSALAVALELSMTRRALTVDATSRRPFPVGTLRETWCRDWLDQRGDGPGRITATAIHNGLPLPRALQQAAELALDVGAGPLLVMAQVGGGVRSLMRRHRWREWRPG